MEHGQLTINETSYDISQVEFVLNIDQREWLDSSINQEKIVKMLPIWGNYILVNNGQKFEFKPSEKLTTILDDVSVSGYKKRPALMVKTSDLFDSLMSMLWLHPRKYNRYLGGINAEVYKALINCALNI